MVLIILALISFGAAVIVALIERSWPLALIALGLFLTVLPRVT